MSQKISLSKWVEVVGKGKLQDFHDRFAHRTGIALKLIDDKGKELLVPSRGCLLCEAVKGHANAQCQSDHVLGEKIAANKGKLEIFTCSTGLTVFICPLYSSDTLIGFGVGGYVSCEHSPIAMEILEKYKVPIMTKKELKEIGECYETIANLLNVDYEKLYVKTTYEHEAKMKVIDPRLTTKEVEVAEYICQGLNNKEIATRLNISEKTLKNHVSHIFCKLDIKDRTQVVAYYSKKNL